MEKRKLYVTNFTTLASHDGGGRYRVIRNEAGDELGIEVSGTLTTFDVRNENGGVFKKESYDKFVDEYFIANSLNVPLCLYHNDWDIRMVCGVVKSMTKTDSGGEMVGWIPKTAYFYNLIKSQIDNGILQGFSNAGGMRDYEWDEENNAIKVTDFALLHASLVATPADTGAWLDTQNTLFNGFEPPIDNEVNPKNKPETPKPFELIL
jgi:hypothetical protein